MKRIQQLGIRKFTASVPHNFDQLILFSLYGSTKITDRAISELVKFPRLALLGTPESS